MSPLERLRQILSDFWRVLTRRREESAAVRLPKIRAEREQLIKQQRILKKRKRKYSHIAQRLGDLMLEEFRILAGK